MRTSWSACATKRLQRTVTWERCFSQAYKKLDVRAMPPHGETPATHFFCVPARTGSNLKIGNGVDQLLPKEMRANRVGCVSVSNCLTRFAKRHWLGHHPQGVNLNRKMWHSAIRKMQGTRRSVQSTLQNRKHATLTGKNGALPDRSRGKTQRQGSTCTSSCSKILLLGRMPKKLLLGSTCWTVFWTESLVQNKK